MQTSDSPENATPPVDIETERARRIAEFVELRDRVAEELQRNLAREGITIEEFLTDVLELSPQEAEALFKT